MPTKIGPFEILSELAKSATAVVYKANDSQSGQTVALKVIQLSAFGESATDLKAALIAEAESTKTLSSPNIVAVFGAGEIEGQFCATMEYVQGNSVATMLANKEGFSIWDLLDIGRQVCGGLDHARSHRVFHFSLEPAKIMCGWDGTIKILGFGVSSVGRFAPQTAELPAFLNYMSPEQIRGEPIDARSNLFSLGAMFFEMVTGSKAFDGPDSDSLCQAIVEGTPTSPVQLNPKVHPLLSNLIMKALEKEPEQRYQTVRELLDDLEQCKDSKAQAAKKPAESNAAPASAIPAAAKAAAQSKFVPPAASHPSSPAGAAGSAKAQQSPAGEPRAAQPSARPEVTDPVRRAVSAKTAMPEVSSAEASAPLRINQVKIAQVKVAEASTSYDSAQETELMETFSATPAKMPVDPMMAESANRAVATSFSEISELPPLKEIYAEAPPPPPLLPTPLSATTGSTIFDDSPSDTKEKQKVQPREVAQKALNEIKSVPPRLVLYSVTGALALILVLGIGLAMHIHNLNSEVESGSATPESSAPTATVEQLQPAAPQSLKPHPVQAAPKEETAPEAAPVHSSGSARSRSAKKIKTAPPAASPILLPGQLGLDSTPQGAQVQIDGRSDSTWVTPFALSGVAPGQHTITATKPGYAADTRTVEIASGNKSSLILHLAQLMATLSVTSNPPGANVYIDGRDSGSTTPSQINVEKGQHVILIRKMGFIDETATPQFVLGQTIALTPQLRPLGNAESIRTVGKMKKLFGGAGAAAGQVNISVRTQPKGAQVTVNQHMIEKSTPVDVALDPGNYVIDITLSGYAPIHKVITADKGSKLVVDEILQRQ